MYHYLYIAKHNAINVYNVYKTHQTKLLHNFSYLKPRINEITNQCQNYDQQQYLQNPLQSFHSFNRLFTKMFL